MTNKHDKTIEKTLWSETLLDILIVALVAKKPDAKIKELLVECKQKGFKKRYLVGKMQKEIDNAAAARIDSLYK